jgi:hypothetical protein
VSGLGEVVFPLLDAVGELFGEKGFGGVVGDLLDLQDAGRKGVFLDAGVRAGLFREWREACEAVAPAQGEPGAVWLCPSASGGAGWSLGHHRTWRSSAPPGRVCPVGRSRANGWRTDCRKSGSS